MFLLMFTFFIYPSDFSIQTAKDGTFSQQGISGIMAMMDVFGFLGGLLYSWIRKRIGNQSRFVAPALSIAGFALLALAGGRFGTVAGSVFVGFSSGVGIPFIISNASMKAGRSAGTTVLPLVSAALYLAQFLTPMILHLIKAEAGDVHHLPYLVAIVSGLLLFFWSFTIKDSSSKETVLQEEMIEKASK